jgi:hypothetical protein
MLVSRDGGYIYIDYEISDKGQNGVLYAGTLPEGLQMPTNCPTAIAEFAQ